jgi:hypothetical protein
LGHGEKGVPDEVIKKALESGNETWYDMAYNYPGNTLGNKDVGDGWKYRGRGLVQITGKANYTAVGNILKSQGMSIDLVNDPDSITRDYGTAVKAMGAYYANVLGGGNAKKGYEILNGFKTKDEALRMIIRATAGMGHDVKGFEEGYKGNKFNNKGEAVGEHLFVNYQRALKSENEADKILSLSNQNSDMKKQGATSGQPIQQNTVNNFNNSETPTSPMVNDRPPLSGRK